MTTNIHADAEFYYRAYMGGGITTVIAGHNCLVDRRDGQIIVTPHGYEPQKYPQWVSWTDILRDMRAFLGAES